MYGKVEKNASSVEAANEEAAEEKAEEEKQNVSEEEKKEEKENSLELMARLTKHIYNSPGVDSDRYVGRELAGKPS